MIKPNLHALANRVYTDTYLIGKTFDNLNPAPNHSRQEKVELGIAAIGKNWSRAGFEFVPLVMSTLVLRCSLDIMLLRHEGNKKFIFEGSDIDAQLKTLFDALRIPNTAAEANGEGPYEGETPFFCLLEDDKLITEVHVVSDELLLLPNRPEIDVNDAFAVIGVRINHKDPGTTWDRFFD
jgi:hypothetical protein